MKQGLIVTDTAQDTAIDEEIAQGGISYGRGFPMGVVRQII